MSDFPHARTIDDTLALLAEGYTYIGKRCAEHGTDTFETRLMLQHAVCTQGEEAAAMFYQPDRFTRNGAMPPTALLLLQDLGSVQTLDSEAHRRRKALFLSLLDPAEVDRLTNLVVEEWQTALPRWVRSEEVVLHAEAQTVLTRAVCRWAGVPLHEDEVEARTREFGEMIEGAGSVGLRNLGAQALRTQTERWARQWIEDIRERKRDAPVDSPAYTIATYRETNDQGSDALLDPGTAAVELINLLRPTVAVANYIVFAALALHEQPAQRARLIKGGGQMDEQFLEWFVQEVRRFYPFFPAIGGKVLEPFEWRGHQFDKGEWVLLDIYGTNHDGRSWEQPEVFNPERFRTTSITPYNLVAQGAGEYANTHRCPGEPATVAILKTAVRLLVCAMTYATPEQDLSIDLGKMPALPTSRFVMRNVRAV